MSRAALVAWFVPALLGLASVELHANASVSAAEALAPERVAKRIEEHRTALATVIVVDVDGRRLANRPVAIEQTAHQFLFGCNVFRLNPDDNSDAQIAYQQRFAALWNFATLPFYWGSYEPVQGEPRFNRLHAMAEWCRDHEIATKGHPLCWHQVTPRWVADLPLDHVHRSQLDRIDREVTAFTGLIDIWDVANEAVTMPRFDRDQNPITALCRKLDRLPLITQTFHAARRANPAASLILNAYDRLLALIQGEWWTDRRIVLTDDHGRIVFRGFLGRYSLAVDDVTTTFQLRQPGQVTIVSAIPKSITHDR